MRKREIASFNSNVYLAGTAAFLTLIIISQPAETATRRRTGPSGGVYLQTPEPQTPEEHNNRGVELGNKGLWQDAIREHEAALAAEPTNQTFRTNLSAAQLRYGDYLASKKDYYNAIKQYRGALYVDPNNSPADEHLDECLKRTGVKDPLSYSVRRNMAEDFDSKGDYEEAIVEFNKCVKMKDDGESHMNLGRVYHKAGKDVEAFKELEKALVATWDNKSPNYARDLASCHRELGDILKDYAYKARDQGRTEDGMKRLLNAGTEYRRAVTVNPLDTTAIQGLLETSRDAVAINPKSFNNHLMLAGAYQLAGDFDHAEQEYAKAWELSPDDYRLAKARRSYWLAVVINPVTSPALLAKTLQTVERQVQKNQNDPELLYIYGRGKEAQGDRDMALAAYNRARSINQYVNPDLMQGIARLGGGGEVTQPQQATSGQQNKPTAAQLAAEKAKAEAQAKEEAAKEEALRAQQAYAGIEGKIRQGDLDSAQQELLALVDKNHSDGHAWLLLGNTQEKKGQLDEAAVSYRQASNLKDPAADAALRQINTSRIQPIMETADKFIKDGNQVQAAASLREALSIAPDLASVHKKLAEVLKALGDTKEADKELKKAQELEKQH